MSFISDRLKLPLLASGQAQKELTHNEALTLIDFAIQPVVASIAPAQIPVSPAPGQCWIAGGNATGAWAGHSHHLCCWTEGGWRFVASFPGFTIWSVADAMFAKFNGSTWEKGQINAKQLSINGVPVLGSQRPAISDASGGTNVDAECRLAVAAVLDVLRQHGLIAT
jgi:hypothetical protein